MNWMTMGEDAGDIVGPIFAGFLWTTWGITFALGARALLALMTEIYAVTLTGSLEKRKITSQPRFDLIREKYLSRIKITNDGDR